MDRISGLSDELLVKILSFAPTEVAVSTSILSKRWKFVWMWVPKLEFVMNHFRPDIALQDFIDKNLPLLRAPVIEKFRLQCFSKSFRPEDINRWVGITISRCIRELDINYFAFSHNDELAMLLPSSLYTCKSLVTLKLNGHRIHVDVPRTVSLPSLKNLLLREVTYSAEDSLRLLLSYCPLLEDLVIARERGDNIRGIVVISPSLQRLTLPIDGGTSDSNEYVIVAPSLKYITVEHYAAYGFSYLVAHMPKVEEADIVAENQRHLEKILESVTSVKRISLCVWVNEEEEYMYHDGIYFSQLEHLKLCISFDYWLKLLFRLLQDSPKLRVLKLYISCDDSRKYKAGSWNNNQSSVPECLLESLESFEFAGYRGRPEERDFVSFIFKNACRLKSSSIMAPLYPDEESCSSTET
ncbi:FBD-associated F-box protein At2g26860 [Raphanus sativus]|uniref:FBD-associated F-box protein At2g26860 n=1 Tax=Raphanus sativus TaxID=3726 RepID=A0A6J0M1Y9_RAPSA|nr:FBD-associated F-box protein At2g26860 [Raphanus sativus]